LASKGSENILRIWSLTDLSRPESIVLPAKVLSLAMCNDSRTVVTGDWDGSVRLWNLSDGHPLSAFAAHKGVGKLAPSPDGDFLASASGDGTMRLWTFVLTSLIHRPVPAISDEDRAWLHQTLHDSEATDAERHWLEFLHALLATNAQPRVAI
jgi:WD40 repeat protein